MKRTAHILAVAVALAFVACRTGSHRADDWADAGGQPPTTSGGINDGNTGEFTTGGSGGAGGFMVIMLAGVVSFVIQLYFIYMEGTTGQSPGKKLTNIRVISEQTGQPIGFGMAFVRKLAHILDAIPCYVGFLWPLFDAKKQTFADKVMNTVVVRSI